MVTMTQPGPFVEARGMRGPTLPQRLAVPLAVLFILGVPGAWIVLRFVTNTGGWILFMYMMAVLPIMGAQVGLLGMLTRSKRHTPDGYPPRAAARWTVISAVLHVATALCIDDYGDSGGAARSLVSSATTPTIGFIAFAVCAAAALIAFILAIVSIVRTMNATGFRGYPHPRPGMR